MGTVGALGSYIAIDDISIDSGPCAVSSQMFSCSPNQSIPMSKVCDNVRDCLNGNDENVCGSCDFKNRVDCGYKHQYIGMH